jgi:predicted small lipoprotein YifL
MKYTFILFLLLATVIFVMTGCGDKGPKLIPVTGTITQNGKTLNDVRLEFSKIGTGERSYAEPDAEGKFTLRHSQGNLGAEPGRYRVSVFQKGKPISPSGDNNRRRAEGDPPIPTITPEVQLTMSDQKPIEIEITNSGENNIVIDLK